MKSIDKRPMIIHPWDKKSREKALKILRAYETLERAYEVLDEQEFIERRNLSLSFNPLDWIEGLVSRLVKAVLRDPKPKR